VSTAKAWLKTSIRRAARLVPRKPRPAILMYHRVGRETFDPWSMLVEPDRFAAQIEWLSRNRTVLPLAEFARLNRERRLPREAVALTFDDGYASVLEAVPLLQTLGLLVTVFVPAGLIQSGAEFWWDELARMVLRWPAESLHLDSTRWPVPPAWERDRSWSPDAAPQTPRQRLYLAIWSKLWTRTPAALGAAMTELREQVPAIEPDAADRALTPEQMRSISPATMSFGSHGLTHPCLPALDHKEKLHEIGESRARCAAITGIAPEAFAYPYGRLDKASRRLVEEAGYGCGCAAGDIFVTQRSNPFALPRLNVGNWEPDDLRDMLGA
jgi:peptidoglycan/xylan/chitin deacetylase (PgdA/CDA1 family)